MKVSQVNLPSRYEISRLILTMLNAEEFWNGRLVLPGSGLLDLQETGRLHRELFKMIGRIVRTRAFERHSQDFLEFINIKLPLRVKQGNMVVQKGGEEYLVEVGPMGIWKLSRRKRDVDVKRVKKGGIE